MELKGFLCMTLLIAFSCLSYAKQTPWQKKISALENMMHRMEGVINEQSKQIMDLEKVNDDQSEQLKVIQATNNEQSEKITALGEETKNQVSINEPYGFTAYNLVNTTYNEDDVVVLGGIISNFGDFYDPELGTFTCQLNGIYMFGADILSQYGLTIAVQFMIGSDGYATAYADDTHDVYQSASGTIVAQCLAGQEVWLRCAVDNSAIQSHPDLQFSTFYGVLLYTL